MLSSTSPFRTCLMFILLLTACGKGEAATINSSAGLADPQKPGAASQCLIETFLEGYTSGQRDLPVTGPLTDALITDERNRCRDLGTGCLFSDRRLRCDCSLGSAGDRS